MTDMSTISVDERLSGPFARVLADVQATGVDVGEIAKVSVNNRLTSSWGRCAKFIVSGTAIFRIEVNQRLLNTDDDYPLRNTLAHEIIHTVPGCYNHGDAFKCVGGLLHKLMPEYNIRRTTSALEYNLPDLKKKAKYLLVCEDCKTTWEYQRRSKVVGNPQNYHCSCGGKIRRVR